MDRKTTNVLNCVVRELFEDGKTGIGVTAEGVPVEVTDEGPLGEKELNAMRNKERFFGSSADAAADAAQKAAQQEYEASMRRAEIGARNIRERNPHNGPDPALGRKLEFDYEVNRHNPKTGPDPALGDLEAPWYQQGWQWVQDHPGYATMAAGAPLALAAGAYYLNKRRKGNK